VTFAPVAHGADAEALTDEAACQGTAEGEAQMLITIVYESMFGETRRVAEAIARGAAQAGGGAEVTLRRVTDITPGEVGASDVLIVGGPTHVHSMSRPVTRVEAENWSRNPDKAVVLEPGALGVGVREFLAGLPATRASFAAFDTRADSARILTGSAARAIRKRLVAKGLSELMPSRSFAVTADGGLIDGELERAIAFGTSLVNAVNQAPTATRS